MKLDKVGKIPSKITVSEVLSSRYRGATHRPSSWDNRRPGNDVVKTIDGTTINLSSDGGQSTPEKGWSIVLTGGDAERGYEWTLYGISRS